MTNKKSTKRALLMSVLSLLLCVSMLIGTTYAWFTDSVTSAGNKIVAGTLDVDLLMYTTADKYESIADKDAAIFGAEDSLIAQNDITDTLWEPGKTQIVYLAVANKGNLDLKYNIALNVLDGGLVGSLEYAIVDGANAETNSLTATSWAEIKDVAETGDVAAGTTVAAPNGALLATKTDYFALAVHMKEEAGNEYQGKDITIDVKVNATQLASEEDSFDNQYDADAAWDGTADTSWYNDVDKTFNLNTASELAGLAEIVNGTASTYSIRRNAVQDTFKGKTIILGADVNLMNMNWAPIGNSTNKFQGTFDGNGHTISNLFVSMAGKSNAGFFGFTTEGAVKNIVFENAHVSGRLNVGVVAGTPYTSTYNNITVKGDVTVNGMSYVGGAFGKSVYADVTDITIDANEGSYVSANSVENGLNYRTYVGGVIGFMGEGGHTVSNVTSNIDVIGSSADVGGITGIAHYGNNFVNCSSSGNVTITDAENAGDAEEIGGIAGVWHNGGSNVTFTNCKYTGKLSVNITEGVDLSDNIITGKAYSASGSGKLVIDNKTTIATKEVTVIDEMLKNGENVVLADDVSFKASETTANSGYGATGVKVAGGTFDGNGNTLTVTDAWTTWDCAVNTTGGTIKNLTINSAMRGIFMGGAVADVYIDNVVIDGTIYTFNSDSGNKEYGVYISNTTLNGWTSYSNSHKEVVFTNCNFGEGNGYAYCRPYNATEFKNCVFEEGYEIDARNTIVFENCYIGETPITSENVSTLVTAGVTNATVK